MYTSRISWETLRSVDSATLVSGAAWYAVGTPLVYPSYKLKMVNNSTVLVTVSINGVTAIDVLPETSAWIYDEDLGDKGHESIPAGTQIYVQAAAAGTGLIYLVSQYIVQV